MQKCFRICLLAAGFLLASGSLFAQSGSAAALASVSQTSAAPEVSQTPAAEAEREHRRMYGSPGDKPVENVDEEENSQFKYSSIVRGLAHKTGLSKESVYWIFNIVNFAILVGLLVWVVKKAMPNGFAPRTAEIQKGIEEARKASAEAAARLGEIEGRLNRLDAEIAQIRSTAEADFAGEEQRIQAEAERDAKLVIAAAEQEIAAASRAAHRELKAFAAGLAIDLAEKKINVNDVTDQALVRGFATQLLPQQADSGLVGGPGKDGQ